MSSSSSPYKIQITETWWHEFYIGTGSKYWHEKPV